MKLYRQTDGHIHTIYLYGWQDGRTVNDHPRELNIYEKKETEKKRNELDS